MDSRLLASKIRINAVKMVSTARASHIGGALSVADILAVLYADIMFYDVKNPQLAERDRLILSKGHNGVAVYATLAEIGFLDKKITGGYYSDGSILSGHVSHKDVSGVEFSTGSLGHGICVAAGMAASSKYDKLKHKIFAIVGDGECDEGSVWEAALFANHYKLDNLTVIVDHNKLQGMGECEKNMDLLDLAKKWSAFGWQSIEVDGHNHDELRAAFAEKHKGPKCIIAHTIKGKGVSFMENELLWHYRDPQGELLQKALSELENAE